MVSLFWESSLVQCRGVQITAIKLTRFNLEYHWPVHCTAGIFNLTYWLVTMHQSLFLPGNLFAIESKLQGTVITLSWVGWDLRRKKKDTVSKTLSPLSMPHPNPYHLCSFFYLQTVKRRKTQALPLVNSWWGTEPALGGNWSWLCIIQWWGWVVAA